MENSLHLNVNVIKGTSIDAYGKSANTLTGVVSGCLIFLTIVVAVKILKE